MSITRTITPTVAATFSGEAMWLPFQAGFAAQMGEQLQQRGYGEFPYSALAGSSSGSLVAAMAAGGTFDHQRIQSALIDFAREANPMSYLTGGSRLLASGVIRRAGDFLGPLGTIGSQVLSSMVLTREQSRRIDEKKSLNPYMQALERVFEKQLINLGAVIESPTQLTMTASRYNSEELTRFRGAIYRLLWEGVAMLSAGPSEMRRDNFDEKAAVFFEGARHLFRTVFFATQRLPEVDIEAGDQAVLIQDSQKLLEALMASTRIPYVLGSPLDHEMDRLIDGVFDQNAPLQSLDSGAQHVFIVNSSRRGLVFPQPVNTLALRHSRNLLEMAERSAKRFDFLPTGSRFREAVCEIAKVADRLPHPAPLDLEALRQKHPNQSIYVIHPKNPPRVNRFAESNPETLLKLYEMGRQEAREHAGVVRKMRRRRIVRRAGRVRNEEAV
jgi:predicted acylesterase/phospholipase RssA